jgi:tRNA1(Val) A37 N6-methylase TrmN6
LTRRSPDETLGPYAYRQNETRLTGDTLALSEFATVSFGWRVCDLGCGAGALLLLLKAREPSLRLFGAEISPSAVGAAQENLARNGLDAALFAGDWADYAPGVRFELVVSNPPYYVRGRGKVSADPARALARAGDEGTLPSLCAAAARLLRHGGRFALCCPAFRLADGFAALRAEGLEPKRLRLRGKLALLEARKGGKPGLEVEP